MIKPKIHDALLSDLFLISLTLPSNPSPKTQNSDNLSSHISQMLSTTSPKSQIWPSPSSSSSTNSKASNDTHHISFLGLDFLPQTTHIQPVQPRNGAPFTVGLIKTHHAHHTHKPSSFLKPPICHKPPTCNLYNQETTPHLLGSYPAHGPSTMSVGNTPNPVGRNRPKGNY